MNTDIQLGDYVLASHHAARNMYDPWCVGFVCQILDSWTPCVADVGVNTNVKEYRVGDATGKVTDQHWYQHCKKISKEEGREWSHLAATIGQLPT